MSWFGGKKKKEDATPQEAIQRLRTTEEMLQKKSDFLETKITQEMKTAKTAGLKNKRVALNALKRKKRYEAQLNQIDGTLSTIEFQREALENANTNTEVLKNMGFAAKALKSAHDELGDIDSVHDLMDDINEQQELATEISDAISRPVGFGNEIDDDDLLAELESMEQEAMDEAMLDVPNVDSVMTDLPSVPTGVPTRQVQEEEDEDMAALAAWAT